MTRIDPTDSRGEAPGRALYGLAGWHYDDWAGIVYPAQRPRDFRPIEYLARYFDVLEIDTSFYRIPAPLAAQAWARQARSRPGFELTMKLWQGFTHAREKFDEPSARAFDQAAAPLADSGVLGCVLIQFPWSFRAGEDSLAWIRQLLDRFAAHPLAVEVRHASWLKSEAFFSLLAERGAAFCDIDQPALRDCLGLTGRATAPHAYLRVHGRNRANWFREEAGGAERYDYLYSELEIIEIAGAVESLKRQARKVYVITNNHWRGQAAANALQLRGRVEGAAEAPSVLLRHFGPLGPGVAEEQKREGEQLEFL